MICIEGMGPGGAERQVTYLAKGFVEAGHEIHVTLINTGTYYDRLAATGARIHFVDIYPKSLNFIAPILMIFRFVRPDVVYLWLRPFDVLGGLAALMLGLPAVQAERTDHAQIAPGFKVWLRHLVSRFSVGVIANSDAGFHYWQKHLKKQRIFKLPNVVPYHDLQNIEPSDESKGCAIAVGRLDANKNVLTLLRAIKRLQEQGIYFRALIVGEGKLASALRLFALEEGIIDRVKFLGFREDAWSLMKGSEVFISLSYFEGEPNVVLEATALGCRLILSDIPSHRTIASATDAIYVRPDSAIDVAEAIKLQRSGQPTSAVPGEVVSGFFESRAPAEICRKHIEVFRSLLAERSCGTGADGAGLG